MHAPAVEVTTPFGPRDAGVPMTLDEFDAADFELGYRYELIHGVFVVIPPPLEEERDDDDLFLARAPLGEAPRPLGRNLPDSFVPGI